MNVLLVEDEPRVADFIDRGLRAENHGVTVASSGTEGVDLAKTGEFDVIVRGYTPEAGRSRFAVREVVEVPGEPVAIAVVSAFSQAFELGYFVDTLVLLHEEAR